MLIIIEHEQKLYRVRFNSHCNLQVILNDNNSINYQNTLYSSQLSSIIKNMSSVQHNPGLFFLVKFQFVVYGYDPNTKNFKDPVFELFLMFIDILSPWQNTVEDVSSQCMNFKPTVSSGVRDSRNKYLVHHILPPVVYPCDPTFAKLADVVNCYRDSNPLSNSMTITVDLIEKSEIA